MTEDKWVYGECQVTQAMPIGYASPRPELECHLQSAKDYAASSQLSGLWHSHLSGVQQCLHRQFGLQFEIKHAHHFVVNN